MKLIINANRHKRNVFVGSFCGILFMSIILHLTYAFIWLKGTFHSLWHPATIYHDPFVERLQKHRFNISALVFYGRRRYVKILNCYLEQNLIENGGLLSEVIFVSKTNQHADIMYLQKLVAQHPGTYFIRNDSDLKWTFHVHYRNLDPNRYYVKIDDDVLYIHPNAIQSMLEAKLFNSDAIFITANVINHPNFAKLHLHLRAVLNITNSLPIAAETGLPICNWTDSKCANVFHRSFLKHQEEKTLDAYVFPLWDYNALGYNRWSINFFLFKGNDVQDVGPGDDEHQISIVIPKKLKKHTLVVGTALVVHFGYRSQRHSGLKDNDFVPAYLKLAQKICNNTLRAKRKRMMMSGKNYAS